MIRWLVEALRARRARRLLAETTALADAYLEHVELGGDPSELLDDLIEASSELHLASGARRANVVR